MKTIILASTSPRRKQLLKQLGLEFKVFPSEVDEKFNPRLKARGQAEVLSVLKAEAVAERQKNAIVIAADTIVTVEEEIMGKPRDEKEAKRMLKKLSGKCHTVVTAYTIIDTDKRKKITKSCETLVCFKHLSDREVTAYVKTEKLTDKAGAYAVQGIGAIFIERIDGDFYNVMGLPLCELAKDLRKFGVEVL